MGSVLSQTHRNFELIVVDDGSTDNTVEVVRGFQDPRIRLLCHAKNCGASRARNEGVRSARGEWVAFLDDDDEWLPRKLELQMARLHKADDPRTTVVYCRGERSDGAMKNRRRRSRPLREGQCFEHLLRGWVLGASHFLVKRSALLDVGGFDEELADFEDWDLWLRLAQSSNYFVAVNEGLVVVLEHPGPRLSTDLAGKWGAFKIVDHRWGPVMKRQLGRRAYRRWRAARYGTVSPN